MNDESKLKILSLLSKIDNLYNQKAKGAYVRSGARWIEKGGKKAIVHFSDLKKGDRNTNTIHFLYINGIINNWPKIISSKIFTFLVGLLYIAQIVLHKIVMFFLYNIY